MQHLAQMLIAFEALEYVNTFMICFNSEQPRMDENLRQMLTIFKQMFGGDFFENVVFCFTRWSFDERSQ